MLEEEVMTPTIATAHERLTAALAELIEASTMAVSEDAVARRALFEGMRLERERIVGLLRARMDLMGPTHLRIHFMNAINEIEENT